MTIAFLNICNLRYKVHELSDHVHSMDWDIVGVAETWLTNTVANNEIEISGYSLVRLDRAGRPGGGVCLYYRATLPVTVQPDLKVDGIEAVWISLHHSKQGHLFGCMYRPPC